ncbi:Circadian clock protein kinase KaiC [Candidatus Methanoperedenaceae archaeon GB37]|nr:Circadian clock protein kinase KaiC [Candidatus Methanoperedenaceae archaeon GB37]
MIDGGFRKNTVNVLCGGPGAGKSTFAIQYILHNLNRNHTGLLISFEMSEKQIIQDCLSLGFFEIEEHIENGSLTILHFFGEDLVFPPLDFIQDIREVIKGGEDVLISIDPFTYLTLFMDETERKFLSMIFQELREIGTTVVTLEENKNGSPVTLLPLYLADSVICLEDIGMGELYNRTLKIVKTRGARHGEGLYPYSIENGVGIVVEATMGQKSRIMAKRDFDDVFDEEIGKIARSEDPLAPKVSRKLEVLKDNWVRDSDPRDLIDLVIRTELGSR